MHVRARVAGRQRRRLWMQAAAVRAAAGVGCRRRGGVAGLRCGGFRSIVYSVSNGVPKIYACQRIVHHEPRCSGQRACAVRAVWCSARAIGVVQCAGDRPGGRRRGGRGPVAGAPAAPIAARVPPAIACRVRAARPARRAAAGIAPSRAWRPGGGGDGSAPPPPPPLRAADRAPTCTPAQRATASGRGAHQLRRGRPLARARATERRLRRRAAGWRLAAAAAVMRAMMRPMLGLGGVGRRVAGTALEEAKRAKRVHRGSSHSPGAPRARAGGPPIKSTQGGG